MSLESQIADLVSATNSLIAAFNTKKAGIDAAVAAAIAAVPTNYKSYYVNALSGSDNAEGTAAAPLKTIDKAVGNTPVGGVCLVYLQADYQLTGVVNVDGRYLHVRSDTAGVRRKLTSGYYSSTSGDTYMCGFVMHNGGYVMATDLSLVLPSPAGIVPAPTGFTYSMFKTNMSGGTVLAGIKLTSCDITAPADWAGWVLGSPNSALVFEAYNVTFPAVFGGRYVYAAAAGTSPATLPNLLTNLPAL